MLIYRTPFFEKCYRVLSKDIQKQADKKLALFFENPRHPSLHIKKMTGYDIIWEGRISKGYRFTFEIRDKIYIFRKIGSHDILKNP